MAFPVAECITMVVMLTGMYKFFHKDLDNIG